MIKESTTAASTKNIKINKTRQIMIGYYKELVAPMVVLIIIIPNLTKMRLSRIQIGSSSSSSSI